VQEFIQGAIKERITDIQERRRQAFGDKDKGVLKKHGLIPTRLCTVAAAQQVEVEPPSCFKGLA
jgi:hypothetical protein